MNHVMKKRYRITLIHPSRGRPIMAKKAYLEWMRHRSSKYEIEYIISLDSNDTSLSYYYLAFQNETRIISNNRSIVDAVNIAAKKATGDLIVVMSDDFHCPKGWDDILIQTIKGKELAMVKVNDGIQKEVMTLPILTKALYDKIGYIYYTEYFSMFADNDITEIGRKLGVLIELPVLFRHSHYTVTKQKPDITYRRENSPQAYSMGKAIFERRMKNNFGL